jgi:hypothetical protein
MDGGVVDRVADRIAGDVAFQRAICQLTELPDVAAWLAQLEGDSGEWLQWLDRARSRRDLPPVWHFDTAPPTGWLPLRLIEGRGGWMVEWVHGLFTPLNAPFFEDDIRPIARHPANLVLRCLTPIDAVRDLAPRDQPDTLVFHVSRCGSTLVAQMFRALDDARVLAEPPVFDSAVQLYLRGEIDAGLLRGVAAALGRGGDDQAHRTVLKLDSWHCLTLDRIADAFPQARCILLFRDPVEILVSQTAHPGMHVLKGAVPFGTFGLEGALEVANDDFAAWAIAGIMRGALASSGRQGLLLCDYSELPDAFVARILPHCGIMPSAQEVERMVGVAARNAKQPNATFLPDTAAKQSAANADLRERIVSHGLDQAHRELMSRAGLQPR